MGKRYGISLSRDVTEVFVGRLVDLSLLKRDTGRQFLWQANNRNREEPDQSGLLDKVVGAAATLHLERANLLTTKFDQEKFLEALMEVVLDQNADLTTAVQTIAATEGPVAPSGPAARNAEQYFAAEFITWAKLEAPEIFQWLAELNGTALVAEALIDIRTPHPNHNVTPDVMVHLDAPFTMELLGLSGAAARQDAKYIVDTLQRLRIPVSVFSHSIDELIGNIDGVLHEDIQKRVGPTATALLFKEVTEDYLLEVKEDPEHFLREMRITVASTRKDLTDQERLFFTLEKEQSLYGGLHNLYENELARERDVTSIREIFVRRRGEKRGDVLRCKHLLLTRNENLTRVSRKFARDFMEYHFTTAPPSILVRDLAGVLWLLVGPAERLELSKRQMVLSCSRARAAAPEVISAMYEQIRAVNPDNAELLWAAAKRPAYLSMAMDAVAGSAGNVDQHATDEVLEAIRADLISAERKRHAQQLASEREKYDTEAALQKLIIEQIERENQELSSDKERLSAQLKHTSSALWDDYSRFFVIASRFWIVAVNVVIVIAAFALGFVGTERFNVDWPIKAVAGALLSLVLVYANHRFLREWWNGRISRFLTARYDRRVRELSGPFYNDVIVASPVGLKPPAEEER